jgi:hypothetical protein
VAGRVAGRASFDLAALALAHFDAYPVGSGLDVVGFQDAQAGRVDGGLRSAGFLHIAKP